MNVASIELCKQLWHLSGWETEDWYDLDDSGKPYEHLATKEDIDIQDTGNEYVPAYDLGYLLRKLPIEYKDWGINLRPNVARTLWICGYKSDHNLDVTADNPTDAAAKLAIALFEQGVLHKGGES